MPVRQLTVGNKSVVLDVRPDRLDLRDRMYQPPTLALPPQFPSDEDMRRFIPGYLEQGLVLNQGKEGACTGYGLAAVINYLLWSRALASGSTEGFRSVSPHMLYDLARFYDEWPGQDYDGSSCRGAMKGWHKHGACEAPLWLQSIYRENKKKPQSTYRPDETWAVEATARPLGVYYRIDRRSVTDMQTAIRDVGAVFVSASVHGGWDLAGNGAPPRKLGHAHIPRIAYDDATEIDGGHAFALVGYNEDGFIVQNSWGPEWGLHGFAVMSYDDWVANGDDAWVSTLGVPQRRNGATRAQASRTRRAASYSMVMGDSQPRVAPTNPAAQPWPTEQAYLHSIVAGNDGAVDTARPDRASAEDHVREVVVERAMQWARDTGQPLRLAIYAHGGLNPEEDAIERARILGPYFLGNGIYPIFMVWKTGFVETFKQTWEDQFAQPEEARLASGMVTDARDRFVEAIAHGPLRWAWRQMKSNAQLGAEAGRGIALLAGALADLKAAVPAVEVHLVGHSAGSFVLGHLQDRGVRPDSLTLYAPACPLDFALQKIVPHAPADSTWLHILSDKVERDDCVGSDLIYGKSLLYLVARGFEDVRKTPLAGLERCLDLDADDPDDDLWVDRYWPDVQTWRAWTQSLPLQADGLPPVEISEWVQVDAQGKKRAATHGGFDNDVRTITRTLNRILGQMPDAALPLPVEDLDY
ncbi:C1 family peptidase [Ramlibacter solisilvae]|uniref:Peptidase C1A papain C-terminal domain-containing protein n=1 Tax=Ramlibacter tataouinensis TaxID=94132 RepID=A0A127JYW0_9BURK|nr:C1 family peptidase [Ramlibacter tataouinensis]AMO25141.1 hypothetical protein UC35_22805 [Ramlibacter tataouinensis]